MAVSTIDPNGLNVGQFGNRNLIINSAMQVAQRGTSLTGIGSNAGGPFICDRFQHAQGSTGGSGVTTMEQLTDAPDGFGSSLKLTVTTADTLSGGENVGIRHRIEGQNLQQLKFGSSSAESITVSFWIKASLTGTYGLELFSAAGTRDILKAYTVSVANTWEYKTLTFIGDTNTAIGNNANRGFDLFFALDAGPSDIVDPYTWASNGAFRAPTGQVNFMATNGATWQITGVQMEVGDTATPFEHISYGDQLQKCRRYCQKIRTGTDAGFGMYHSFTTSSAYAPIQLPVTMRATPTGAITSGASVTLFTGGASYTPSSTGFINGSPSSVELKFTTTGNATAGDSGWYRLQTAFTMILDAEL